MQLIIKPAFPVHSHLAQYQLRVSIHLNCPFESIGADFIIPFSELQKINKGPL